MSHTAGPSRPPGMDTKIAVAGGTGMVGALVVEEVRRAGATPVVIARSRGIDLTTGEGLAAALEGVDAVVDASNVETLSGTRSVAFFEAATRHLLRLGAEAGVRHHVALSIVGCDRVDLPYYLGKRRQEELVAAGPVPWSVLRATQFHEFAGQVVQRSPRPLALAPRMPTQPVAAAEVAAALVAAALGRPGERLPDLGGPRPEDMARMVRAVVRARRTRRLVVPVPMTGRAGRQVKAGGLLPGPGATLGTETFDAWLARG